MIYIGIPAYQRKVDIGIVGSIFTLGHDVQLDFADCSIITQARNALVSRFLKSSAEWLLFWDSDIVPSPFIDHFLETSNSLKAGIVSAPCRIKGEARLNCGTVQNGKVENFTEVNGPQLVDVAGSGLMLIARGVCEAIEAPWFEFIQHADSVLGEDFNFCLKAREKGIRVAIDSRVKTMHYGVAGWGT